MSIDSIMFACINKIPLTMNNGNRTKPFGMIVHRFEFIVTVWCIPDDLNIISIINCNECDCINHLQWSLLAQSITISIISTINSNLYYLNNQLQPLIYYQCITVIILPSIHYSCYLDQRLITTSINIYLSKFNSFFVKHQTTTISHKWRCQKHIGCI